MKVLNVTGLVLPALLAVDAAAVARFSPISPRINPIAGLPAIMPSPITGPLAGRGVTLPSPIMTPTVLVSAITLPADAVASAPLAAEAALPAVGMDALRENVSLPSLLPESVLRFGQAAADGKKAPAAPAKAEDELRNLFDGSRKPSDIAWDPILPRERVPQGRRHGLPEDDLERELGVGPF